MNMQVEVLEHARVEVNKIVVSSSEQRTEEIVIMPPKKTFKAPDGLEYKSEAEYKRHLYTTVYSFLNRTGETLVRRQGY